MDKAEFKRKRREYEANRKKVDLFFKETRRARSLLSVSLKKCIARGGLRQFTDY